MSDFRAPVLCDKFIFLLLLDFFYPSPHCSFTIMSHKRISTFQFCFPVFLGMHRNPNWKGFLKSCAILLKLPKRHFWTCMIFKKYFCWKTCFEALWKWYSLKISLICLRVPLIQDLGKKTEIFSKKIHNISKILFNLDFYAYLAQLESKIRKSLFFHGLLL